MHCIAAQHVVHCMTATSVVGHDTLLMHMCAALQRAGVFCANPSQVGYEAVFDKFPLNRLNRRVCLAAQLNENQGT